jgi:hypothetical protein
MGIVITPRKNEQDTSQSPSNRNPQKEAAGNARRQRFFTPWIPAGVIFDRAFDVLPGARL